MKTFLIRKEIRLGNELDNLFMKQKSIREVKTKLREMGFVEHELDEAKKMSHVGDFLTVVYGEKLVPFQVVHIYRESGDRVLTSYYCLDTVETDASDYEHSNVRRYMNNEMLGKFQKGLVRKMKDVAVPFKDKILHDKVFLPSHEELGIADHDNYYKPNIGAKCFDLYKKKNY